MRFVKRISHFHSYLTMGQLFSKRITFDGLSVNDIVIVVIGPTGAGKSTFINTVTGKEHLKVGRGLSTCTKEIGHVRWMPEDSKRQVVFVDTPALFDPEESRPNSEKQIEKKINDWLKKAFGKRIQVAAILYLHRITDNRMTDPPYPNFQMFQRLAGENFYPRVLLVTTMWEIVKPAVGQQRKEELVKHWKEMITNGSEVVVHNGTGESAWTIVKKLLDKR